MIDDTVYITFDMILKSFSVFFGVPYKFDEECYFRHYKKLKNISLEFLKREEQVFIKSLESKVGIECISDSAAEYLTAILILIEEKSLEAEIND